MTTERVLQALKEKKITSREADAYLKKYHGITLEDAQEPSHWTAYALLIVMVSAAIIGAMYLPQAQTGLVVLETSEFNSNITEIDVPVNYTITSISVSGTMHGKGSARIIFIANEEYTVAGITNENTPMTMKPSYLPGEEVYIDNVGEATYYLDDGNQSSVVTVPFPAPDFGNYEVLIVSNDSGNLSTHRISLVVSELPVGRQTTFEKICEETCTLPPTNGTLHIETNGTILEIREAHITLASENLPPEIIPFNDITINSQTSLNLSEHFADEEALFYSTSTSNIVSTSVDNGILTLNPISNGEELFIVYASDLEHLVQASFTLSVMIDNTPILVTSNFTINETANVTLNLTQNATNQTLRCDHPNPNLRPVECIQLDEEEFPPEIIYWQNIERTKVAKFNQLGNLLIKGVAVEQSPEEPGSNDFRIGYPDGFGNTIFVLWIDSEGNLHTKGRLYEEQVNLQPPPGSYSVITRRSIYLSYVNLDTGDIYLRGNLIPYRRSIE